MPTREPVAISHAVTVVLYALVGLGWVTLPDATIASIATAVGVALQLAVAVYARRSVTPLIEPTDVDGVALHRAVR